MQTMAEGESEVSTLDPPHHAGVAKQASVSQRSLAVDRRASDTSAFALSAQRRSRRVFGAQGPCVGLWTSHRMPADPPNKKRGRGGTIQSGAADDEQSGASGVAGRARREVKHKPVYKMETMIFAQRLPKANPKPKGGR